MVYADIDEMVATAYEPYTRDPTIIMCLWKLSCIRQGGYLTLAADDITTFCRVAFPRSSSSRGSAWY